MIKRGISIKDVAREAGVSTAAVSKALNYKTDISPKLRSNIFEVCEKLGYKLNSSIQDIVRFGKNGNTRNIAFVIVGTGFANLGYAYMVDGLASAINKHRYHLMLVKANGNEESIYELPPVLRDERVDGILLTGLINANIVQLVQKMDMKCVVVGNYSQKMLGALSNVQTNTEVRIFNLIEQLVRMGKKRIAFVEESLGNYYSNQVFNSYKNALKEFELPLDKNICYFGDGQLGDVFGTMRPIFSRQKLPFDSIVCTNTWHALEIGHLLYGYFWPKEEIDIVIATFHAFEHKVPIPVVHCDYNVETYMDTALKLLIENINEKEKGRVIVV